MITSRGYWVDWICAFDKPPSSSGIKSAQDEMIRYLRKYLTSIATKSKNQTIKTVYNEKVVEWDAKKLIWGPPKSKGLGQKGVKLGATTDWQKGLKWDWDQISSRPLVFNFKAYFEINGKRSTAETKGTMTPPPPPPPPGSIPA